VGVIPTSLLILAGALTELEVHKLPLYQHTTVDQCCTSHFTKNEYGNLI
jgi:hypothetical protein